MGDEWEAGSDREDEWAATGGGGAVTDCAAQKHERDPLKSTAMSMHIFSSTFIYINGGFLHF